MSDIIEYLDSKKIQYVSQGNEVVITCPQCKKDKLYINKKTLLYQCFVCRAENSDSLYAKGHISQLKNEWGDVVDISSTTGTSLSKYKNTEDKDFTHLVERYKYRLLKNKKGMKYLFNRGFGKEDVERFNFGYLEMKGESWISIPVYENGVPKLLKYRRITNNTDLKKYERETGGKSIIYNGDILDKYEDIYIVAGEFDCCMMIKNGYENTICGTGGEGTLSPYMYDKIYLKESFTLILDADSAGQNAARDVWAKRLGTGRCWNVQLPQEEDVNSFFNKYSKEDFEKFLDKKYKFKVEGVSSIEEALYEMYDRSHNKSPMYALPWKSVNRLLGGGVEKKQLVTIGGQPGFGKTSMVLQIAYHFAINYNLPSLITCLEMDVVKLATKIVQLNEDLDYTEIDPNQALVYAKNLKDVPIYFAYSPTITPEIYYNTVKEARDRYGCELFIFDNLQLFVRSEKESDIGKVTRMFKNNIAMGLDVIMLMVSQPRKLNKEGKITFDDLKGSSAIAADSDIILLGLRKRKEVDPEASNLTFDSFESKATILDDKSRFSVGGKTYLEFIGRKSKFIEIN